MVCIYLVHGGADGGVTSLFFHKDVVMGLDVALIAQNVWALGLLQAFGTGSCISRREGGMQPYKLNQSTLACSNKHDAFMTTIATLCGSAIEITLCHFWATGQIKMQRDLDLQTSMTAVWAYNHPLARPRYGWCIG